jgi:predicted unusual protein kinase regulating ubiquinone biosynthesis (AarF/ABC1/UbiB family)
LRWLLLRPWVLVARLVEVLWQLGSLAVVLVIQGSSPKPEVQKRLAQKILATLTGLGPCFIKVGQSLSTRPDLVRRDWLEQLTQLQDNLPPFPHAIALATIEQELGGPADQLFEHFPGHPVAAASLGQVYKARLRPAFGGGDVAVKVQRPGIEPVIYRDLCLLRVLAFAVNTLSVRRLGCDAVTIIDEFGEKLLEELMKKETP